MPDAHPRIVNSLGYSRTVTLALTAPPYILCVVAISINGWHSDKTQERFLHVVCPIFIVIIANVIAIATTAVAPRYVAMMLLPSGFYSASIVILSWISSTSTGPNIKRAIVYAMINSVCVSVLFSFHLDFLVRSRLYEEYAQYLDVIPLLRLA